LKARSSLSDYLQQIRGLAEVRKVQIRSAVASTSSGSMSRTARAHRRGRTVSAHDVSRSETIL
jgi:hypothetical protein